MSVPNPSFSPLEACQLAYQPVLFVPSIRRVLPTRSHLQLTYKLQLLTNLILCFQESAKSDRNMTEIEQPPPQTNGIDNDEDEKVRPADIEAVC